jgi:hypothetical protein
MNELNGYRAFTHAGSHALHRSVPHISHGKDSRHIRFKQERIPFQLPSLRTLAVAYQVGPGQDKTTIVSLD